MPEINEDDMSSSDMEDTEESDDKHDDGNSDAEISSFAYKNSNSD
jgi:hypothetical protein